MYPIKIIIKNLGLISGEFPLSPVTLITGDNRTGKTTLLKAIQLAETGNVYDPEQGRFSTFDELTAEGVNKMSVRMLYNTGFWVDWKFTRTTDDNGKVTIKKHLDFKDIPQNAIGKSRQAEQALKIVLNPSTYGLHIAQIIEAKTTERRKILLNLLVGSDDSRPLEEWIYSEAEECLNDSGVISTLDTDHLESLTRDLVSATDSDIMILDRLFRINLDVADKLKTAKTELDNTTSVIRTLGFEEAETVDTSEIPGLEKRIKDTETEIEKLAESIGSAKTDNARSATLKNEISYIEDQEKRLGTVRNRDDIDNDKTGLEAEKEKAVEEAENPFIAEEGDILKRCNDAVSTIDFQIKEHRDIISNQKGKIETEETRKTALEIEADGITEKIEALENHNQDDADMDDAKCPICSSTINFQELVLLLSKERTGKNTEIQKIGNSILGMEKSSKDADDVIERLETEKTESGAKKQADLDALSEEKTPVLEAVRGDYDERFKPLDDQIGICDKADEFVKDRIKKEKELNEIQITDISELESTLESRKVSKEADNDKLQRFKTAEKDAKRKTTLETEQLEQMRDVRCLDAIKKATGPKGIPGLLLQEKIDPFIATVNDILHRFAPDMDFNIEFQDGRGKESCQFGFTANKIWTLFESASGVEKRLILFAIVIALMNRETFVNQRIVMLDEISVADEKMAAILIEAAKIAVDEKLIDSAFLAGTLRDSDLEIIMTAHQDVFDSMLVCSLQGVDN